MPVSASCWRYTLCATSGWSTIGPHEVQRARLAHVLVRLGREARRARRRPPGGRWPCATRRSTGPSGRRRRRRSSSRAARRPGEARKNAPAAASDREGGRDGLRAPAARRARPRPRARPARRRGRRATRSRPAPTRARRSRRAGRAWRARRGPTAAARRPARSPPRGRRRGSSGRPAPPEKRCRVGEVERVGGRGQPAVAGDARRAPTTSAPATNASATRRTVRGEAMVVAMRRKPPPRRTTTWPRATPASGRPPRPPTSVSHTSSRPRTAIAGRTGSAGVQAAARRGHAEPGDHEQDRADQRRAPGQVRVLDPRDAGPRPRSPAAGRAGPAVAERARADEREAEADVARQQRAGQHRDEQRAAGDQPCRCIRVARGGPARWRRVLPGCRAEPLGAEDSLPGEQRRRRRGGGRGAG